ncbi:cytochrome c oxidase subunit II [Neoroseomonas nitratireducens]|nr:cytochrome c oxidase subunit II [Neoroseomonas nitratireducens]
MVAAGPAWAQGVVGAPTPWGMGLQESGGPIKDAIADFNTLVFVIIVAITIFVLALLGWCVWRYRAEANPTPSTTSHNTLLEVAWTVVPVLILVVIAIPSFRLIYYQDRTPNADLTISVQGRQWYWNYTYPDHGNFNFDSYPLQEDQLPANQRHLFRLAVDNELVIPVGANIRVLTTGRDVIHSFFVPALGVQRYTIPGRALETWMRADREGVYYGQCNQICGTNHWFMPIAVRAVSPQEFERWVAEARTRFARAEDPAPAVLAAPATTDTVQIAEARR